MTSPILIATISIVAATGCATPNSSSSDPTAGNTADNNEFWSAFSNDSAEEVQPAVDLEDLTTRSKHIARGKLVSIEPYTSFPTKLDDGTTDPGETSLLTFEITDNVSNTSSKTVKVWVAKDSPTDYNGLKANLPAHDYLLFMVPSEDKGIMYATSKAGIIGPDVDGDLTTVLSPTDADIVIPQSADTLEKIQQRAERTLTTD
ncbi:MAG: hypothetical protein ACTIJJ_03805 [Galactobacter sp.]